MVDEWIAVAKADRDVAVLCLRQDPSLRLSATFHCQQAAEKLLKAFCVLADQKFRKTHDMELLTNLQGRRPESHGGTPSHG
ncbi:MAG: HEPN domain-containing protein [Alphaproteobacteria bacterium]